MNEDNKIIIYQNTKGSILYAVGAFAMSMLCFVLLNMNTLFNYFLPFPGVSGIIAKTAFVIGVPFFGYAAFYHLKRLKSPDPVLIVDETGITDKTSAIAFGFIPWADIEGVYLDGILGNVFIELIINDEEKYLRDLNWLKRCTVKINKKMGHQIVCITLNSTGIKPKDVFCKMQELFPG